MKNSSCLLSTLLLVATGLLFTNCENKNEKKIALKPSPITERTLPNDAKKRWEASPDGLKFKIWEASPEGIKVHRSYEKIKNYITTFSDMNAVVTSITFRRDYEQTNAPKWLIIRINEDHYMMQFSPKDFGKLSDLQRNDKIIIRSKSAGYSNNHPYLIISSDYIAKNNKVLFRREPTKNNRC